jgi:mRNA interferase RelE/StbE
MKVNITIQAQKEIDSLPEGYREKLYEELYKIQAGKGQVKTLTGNNTTGKFRIGKYRVLYEIDKKNKTIFVTKVRLRKEVYRDI